MKACGDLPGWLCGRLMMTMDETEGQQREGTRKSTGRQSATFRTRVGPMQNTAPLKTVEKDSEIDMSVSTLTKLERVRERRIRVRRTRERLGGLNCGETTLGSKMKAMPAPQLIPPLKETTVVAP